MVDLRQERARAGVAKLHPGVDERDGICSRAGVTTLHPGVDEQWIRSSRAGVAQLHPGVDERVSSRAGVTTLHPGVDEPWIRSLRCDLRGGAFQIHIQNVGSIHLHLDHVLSSIDSHSIYVATETRHDVAKIPSYMPRFKQMGAQAVWSDPPPEHTKRTDKRQTRRSATASSGVAVMTKLPATALPLDLPADMMHRVKGALVQIAPDVQVVVIGIYGISGASSHYAKFKGE